MKIDQYNTVGVILSGGAGTRMAGLDKGLQLYSGRPLIEPIINTIRLQASTLVICANRNLNQYAEYGYPVLPDTDSTYQGPLAGLVAAVEHLVDNKLANALLVSTCDTPELPIDLFDRLRRAMDNTANVAVAYDGRRSQNLHCLIKRNAWSDLVSFYETGGRAAYQWHKKIGVTEVDFSDHADAFLNINSQQQLESS